MLESFVYGSLYDRVCDGMAKMLFQTRSRCEHFILALFAEYDDA